MNTIKVAPVNRCLDKKMMIMGFEVPDLLIIFLTMSVLNFLFGSTSLKWLLVWVPSAILAAAVRFSKRGKPENYLVHWLRFQIKPGVLCAFMEPTNLNPPPKLNERNNA
jgi:hypothetical protein